MKTFQDCDALLQGRNHASRKVDHNTYLQRRADGSIALRLHATDVVTFYPEYLVLNTGGWYTVTTKDRMDFSGLRVYSVKGVWYVHVFKPPVMDQDWNSDPRYFDGMKIAYDGSILNAELSPVDTSRETAKVKRQIAAYAKLCVTELKKGIPLPSGADCWFCAMVTTDGIALGDKSSDHEHLTSHMEEGYVVPSLLVNAVAEQGYLSPAFILGATSEGMGGSRAFSDGVKRSVSKYLKRRLLPTEEGSKPVGTPAHTGGF